MASGKLGFTCKDIHWSFTFAAEDLPRQGLHCMIKDAIRSESMSLQAVSRKNNDNQYKFHKIVG